MADKIEVTVVVSGQPVKVTVNLNQHVQQLVHEALQRSGNQGQPPGSWELRTEAGDLLNQGLRIGEAGIVQGMTLFLSPKAGIGGNTP